MSNARILSVLNALTANGGGDGILKFPNGIMIIRSTTVSLETTFPVPFVDIPTVFVSIITHRWASSHDRELFPGMRTPTGFSIFSLVVNADGATRVSGYLAIGRWK